MRTNKILMLGFLALGLAGCAMGGLESASGTAREEGDAVRVSTTIARLDSRLAYEEGTGNTTFTSGDKIQVENTLRATENKALYTLNGSCWETDDPFVWSGLTNNLFKAWYPATDGTSFDTFTLPADQGTEELLAAADWMTASTGELARPADNTLSLDFQHQLAKVTVKIHWAAEYEGTPKSVEDAKIYTRATAISRNSAEGVVGINGASLTAIDPLEANESYTAIVAPVEYEADDTFMTLTVNGRQLTVIANTGTLTGGLQPGKHYGFDLKVGRDKITVEHVSMGDFDSPFGSGWGTETDLQ